MHCDQRMHRSAPFPPPLHESTSLSYRPDYRNTAKLRQQNVNVSASYDITLSACSRQLHKRLSKKASNSVIPL